MAFFKCFVFQFQILLMCLYCSGFTFYLGLIFDGLDTYEDTRKYKLMVITTLPKFDGWEDVKEFESGDILSIQVSGSPTPPPPAGQTLCYIDVDDII